MKFSTKGRYALRLMLDIACHSDGGYLSLKEISKRQDISMKYLEQIVGSLSRAGLLKSSRGAQGGYKLTRPPKEYTMGDILRITEGTLAPVSCLEDEPNQCGKAAACITLEFWQGLYDRINEYVDSVTLQDLLEKQKMNEGCEYYI